MTANTITSMALAPAGTNKFGPDLAKADPDGSVDHDERMKVNGIASGTYDARFTDNKGRTCLVKGRRREGRRDLLDRRAAASGLRQIASTPRETSPERWA